MREKQHCENCRWAWKQPLRGPNGEIQIGADVFTCHRAPPTAVMVPVSDFGGTGFALMSNFPPVDKTMFCSMHEYVDDIEGAAPGAKIENMTRQ